MIRDSKRFTILLAILVLVVLTFGNVTAADAPAIEWQKVLGGEGYEDVKSIQQTGDGGYVLAGVTHSNSTGTVGVNHGSDDVWVVKLNSAGTIQWQRVLGGNNYDQGESIQQTSDGGYVLAGVTWSNSSGNVGLNHGISDFWVVKLNSAGAIQWQKVLGGSDKDGEYGASIQQTGDGGYVLAGGTLSNTSGNVGVNHGSSDVWVVKLNSAGAIQWQKVLGGSAYDYGESIQQTSDGGYILAGETWSNSTGDVGVHNWPPDVWVVKLNSAGAIQWQKVLGTTFVEYGKSIRQTGDGGYILAGETWVNADAEVWVVKLNSAGTIQWQKALGGSAYEYGESIRQTGDGGYILTGMTYSNNTGNVGLNHGKGDVWVVKLNNVGAVQWQKTLGGSDNDCGRSIEQTSDAGFILAGFTWSNSSGNVGLNHGGYDIWVVKLASDTVQESSDLEISSGNITITPAIARSTDSVDIAAKITNAGHKDADNVLVQFYAADAYNFKTQIGNDLTIPKIPAGQTATVQTSWIVEEGTFITVLVDPLNSIGEINEENNNATRMSIRIAEIIVRLAEVQTDADIDNLIRYADDMGAEGISVSFKDDVTGFRYYSDPVAQQHLKAIIRKAHNQSIKVYAWIPVFHDNLAADAYPQWITQNDTGPSPDFFISPVRADARSFQLDNISTIANEYKTIDGEKGIDGVRLDYCRYTNDWEDWSSASVQKFEADTFGRIDPLTIDPTNSTAWLGWIDWRADQITSFIDEANSNITNEDPDSDVGVYLMPFSVNKTYHDNSNTGQDYEKIGPLGVKMMPMVYWQDWTSQDRFEIWTDDIIANSREKGGINNIPVISITNKICSTELWYERDLLDSDIEKYLTRSAQIIQKNGGNEISLFYYNKWGEPEKIRVQNALSFRPEYNLLRPSPYTRRYTFDEAPPYSDFDIFSKWEIAPATGHIFAAFDFGFEAETGGYIGTQINENEKLAFFSIWDYKSEITTQPAVPSLDNCVRFGNEGSGVSCNITYNWQQGRDYKLRVVKIGSDETGDIWKGSITDTVTYEETLIGYIHVDSSDNYQGYGGLKNNPGNFLEYFYGMESYLDQPHARVKWTGPLANYGSYIADQAYAGYYSSKTLHQNVFSRGYPETVLEAGENIKLQTPEGTPLWEGTSMVADFTATPRDGTAPLTVRFTDKSTNAPSSWKWTFGDGSDVNSTKKNPVHTYATAGKFTVSLIATNAIGSTTTTKAGYVTVTSSGAMDMVGVYRPSIQKFVLKNGTEKTVIPWGLGTDTPVAGDWNGDGMDDVGVYRPSIQKFILKNGTERTVIPWGLASDTPVAGDWNGDGMDDVGVFRPSIQKFILKNGTERTVVPWGLSTDTPVAGDWNGDGMGKVGVYRPSIQKFILKNGTQRTVIPWGLSTDTPVAGDWNGDGFTDVGVYRPSIQKFILKNGTERTVVPWGLSTDIPVTGKWS